MGRTGINPARVEEYINEVKKYKEYANRFFTRNTTNYGTKERTA